MTPGRQQPERRPLPRTRQRQQPERRRLPRTRQRQQPERRPLPRTRHSQHQRGCPTFAAVFAAKVGGQAIPSLQPLQVVIPSVARNPRTAQIFHSDPKAIPPASPSVEALPSGGNMSTPQIAPAVTDLISDPKQLAAHLQNQRATSGAQEFEASLFSSVLEKMEKNLSIEDDQNSDAGHDTWCALGVRAVSQALAQRHVLGIAGMIEHSLGLKSAAASPTVGTLPAKIPQENK